MEGNKRNNILDNLEENEKRLYELLGILGDIKARIDGNYGLAKNVKEGNIEPEQNTVSGKIGKQTGIIVDILEVTKSIYNSI